MPPPGWLERHRYVILVLEVTVSCGSHGAELPLWAGPRAFWRVQGGSVQASSQMLEAAALGSGPCRPHRQQHGVPDPSSQPQLPLTLSHCYGPRGGVRPAWTLQYQLPALRPAHQHEWLPLAL